MAWPISPNPVLRDIPLHLAHGIESVWSMRQTVVLGSTHAPL